MTCVSPWHSSAAAAAAACAAACAAAGHKSSDLTGSIVAASAEVATMYDGHIAPFDLLLLLLLL
jgi:hypothetical protein